MRPIDAENFEVLSWKATDNQDYNDGFNDGVIFVTEKIDNAPTIDVMPVVHGRWSEKRWMTDDDWGVINHRVIICSACKKEIADGEQTRYCPNCGAKMED